MCVCGQVKGTGHVIEVVTALGTGMVTALVTFLFQFISDNYTPPSRHCFPILLQCCVERSCATLCYTASPLHKMKYINLSPTLIFLEKLDRNPSLRIVTILMLPQFNHV